MKNPIIFFLLLLTYSTTAQECYWQQRVEYTMDIDFNVNNSQYTGNQKLTYFNNSPDMLTDVYFHLYPNAFQPGSMMDVRSSTIEDPDPRVGTRISTLKPEDQGFIEIKSLKLNGNALSYVVSGTILQVK